MAPENKNDENGYIVVETIGVFIPFVLLMVSILSLVNIVTLQTRIHYALTQAANTISMYSYILEITGAANAFTELDSRAERVKKEADELKNDINKVFDGIKSLSLGETAEQGKALLKRAIGLGEEIIDDPKKTLQLILNYGLNEGRNYIFSELVRPLVGRYLANGDMSGDEYLRSVHVSDGLKGLNFNEFTLFDLSSIGQNNSILIDKNGDIRLVVQYKIEYRFGNLPLPFEPALKVTQQVKTKAWLNGSGKGYW